MTYIMGAKCKDGVVLVSDTKVTIDEGASFSYSKKLFKPFLSVVTGASGISGLYKSFQDRMLNAVIRLEQEGTKFDSTKFSIVAEEVIRGMHNVYGEDRDMILRGLNVLMAIRINPNSELINFSSLGIPEPVNDIRVIGHGEPYGALFIKKMWDENKTMEQIAKLAIFIIKLIQETELDGTVGYSDRFLPQVYYLPNVVFPETFDHDTKNKSQEEIQSLVDKTYLEYPIKELTDKEVRHLINQVSNAKAELDSFFVDGKFSL